MEGSHRSVWRSAQGGVPIAVGDVGARRLQVVGGDQCLLDHILDLLYGRRRPVEAGGSAPW